MKISNSWLSCMLVTLLVLSGTTSYLWPGVGFLHDHLNHDSTKRRFERITHAAGWKARGPVRARRIALLCLTGPPTGSAVSQWHPRGRRLRLVTFGVGAEGRRIQISLVVTVKAYPAISRKHGEAVCVAGIRTDTPEPRWVRLW